MERKNNSLVYSSKMFVKIKVIETRLIAYGPLYVKKPPKYWSNLGESFIKARNATG